MARGADVDRVSCHGVTPRRERFGRFARQGPAVRRSTTGNGSCASQSLGALVVLDPNYVTTLAAKNQSSHTGTADDASREAIP